MAAVAFAAGAQGAFALGPLPFIEDFATNRANWLDGASANATWLPTGGVGDGAYISATGTVVASGFGTIVFRGNAGADASGDAFVGNWISGGVSNFSAFVRHNAPSELGIFARLDAGGGRAASSIGFTVAPNAWTSLSIPILDSVGSFQSYGQANPPSGAVPSPAGFNAIFGSMQNIQFVVAPNIGLANQTFTFDVDQISVVPEPGAWGLVAAGLAALGFQRLCRFRSKRNQP
ncbi:MAG: hypothetical protein KGR46_09665 [Verrucomicrobia bacterium]|nr:hypothetical protein [Verrucomicrobiota bacterium]